MKQSRFFGYRRFPLVILISFTVGLCLASCTGITPVQDGLGRRFLSREHGFSFSYPDDWVVAKETYRDRNVTLRLEKQDDSAVNLVFTILPVALNREELVFEARRMLQASLYRIQSVQEEEEKEISGRRMFLIDAVAGEKEKVLTRTAAFSNGKRSCLLTVLASEDAFTAAAAELERILASIDLD